MTVIVWSKDQCPSCEKAKAVLTTRGINFEERMIGNGWTRESLLESIPEARSVPQIVINGSTVGGYEKLLKYSEETGFNGTGHTVCS